MNRLNNIKLVFVLFTFLLYGFFTAYAQDIDFEWIKQIGSSGNDVAYSIVQDNNKNIIVTGWFEKTVRFTDTLADGSLYSLPSVGGRDIFIVKYDQFGDIIWWNQAGSSDDDVGEGLIVDENNNIYIAGRFRDSLYFCNTSGDGCQPSLIANSSQEIFIAKYDQSGDLLWARQAGGITGEASYDISRDSEGNILLAGYFQEFSFFGDTISGDLSDSLISRGNLDIFIAKFNVDGDLIWVTQAGGTENDIVFSVITGEDNSVFLTGSFSGVISFGDTISGNQQIDLTSIGNADFFVAKYDKTGEIEWVKQAGGVFTDSVPNYGSFCTGYSLCSDNMDNIYVTGRLTGEVNFIDTSFVSEGAFIAKYTNQGQLVFARNSGGSVGNSVSCDINGNIYITGYFTENDQYKNVLPNGKPVILNSLGESDIYIATLDNLGNLLWVKNAGGYAPAAAGVSTDAGEALFVDKNENIYFCGQFSYGYGSPSYFGTTQLSSFGQRDIFVGKIGLRINKVDYPLSLNCDEDNDADINIDVKGGFPPYKYSIDGGEIFSDTNSFLDNYKGTYNLVVRDSELTFIYDTIEIKGPIDLGPDTVLCFDSKIIASSGFVSYSWMDGISENNYYPITSSGKYFVEVVDTSSCTSSDTINIYVPPLVDLGNDTAYCGETTIKTNVDFEHYKWFEIFDEPTYKAEYSGLYFVEVTDKYGCASADSANIIINPVPNVNLGGDITIPVRDGIVLDAGNEGVSYLWNDGSTRQVRSFDSTLIGVGSTYYSVTVTNAFNCSNHDLIKLTVQSGYVDCYTYRLSASRYDKSALFSNEYPDNLNYYIYRSDFFAARTIKKGDKEIVFRSAMWFNTYDLPRRPVLKAELFLFHDPDSANWHDNSGGSNEAVLQRIVEPWSYYGSIRWHEQPDASDKNQVFLPASEYPSQNYTDIDITDLMQDMIYKSESSYGFKLQLVTEEPGRELIFCSRYNDFRDYRPTLQVCFYKPGITGISDNNYYENNFRLYPNPGNGLITFEIIDGTDEYLNLSFDEKIKVEVINSTGNLLLQKEYVINGSSVIKQLDCSTLPKGIYFVRIKGELYSQVEKLVIY